jgi:4-hydroxyphenylpyruvate dioxygenase
MRTAQLAINSISTRHGSLEEALDAYAGAGFRNVELSFRDVKAWLAGRPVETFATLLAEHGLRMIGGLEATVACFTSEESIRANRELHCENARLLDAIGGGVITVGTDGPARPSLEALDTVAAALTALAREIEGLDVRIALEFNWSPLIKSLASAALVCEKVNHPQVAVLFDPAHYYTTVTKLEDLTPERVSRVVHVHLDDMRDIPADLSHCNDDRVLPGEGVLDLGALIGALERGGYQGMYAIEMFNKELWQLPAAEAARRCYQSLLPLCSDSA